MLWILHMQITQGSVDPVGLR